MCPDREQNPQPFSDGTALPPTEPPQPGLHPFLGPSSTPGHAGGSLLHPSAGTGATSALAAGAGAAVGTGPPVSWPLGPAPVAARPQADSPGGVCSFLSDRQAGAAAAPFHIPEAPVPGGTRVPASPRPNPHWPFCVFTAVLAGARWSLAGVGIGLRPATCGCEPLCTCSSAVRVSSSYTDFTPLPVSYGWFVSLLLNCRSSLRIGDSHLASSVIGETVLAPLRVSSRPVHGVLCCPHTWSAMCAVLGPPEQAVSSRGREMPRPAQLGQTEGRPLPGAGHSAGSWRDGLATVLAATSLQPEQIYAVVCVVEGSRFCLSKPGVCGTCIHPDRLPCSPPSC